MNWIKYLLVFLILFGTVASAAEVRIKRKQLTPLEADRVASDMAMKDGLLRRGDIIVTVGGFYQYRGLAADGVTPNFDVVANPLSVPARSTSARKN